MGGEQALKWGVGAELWAEGLGLALPLGLGGGGVLNERQCAHFLLFRLSTFEFEFDLYIEAQY